MAKVIIDARKVIQDLRDGLDDSALMTKHRLSATGLHSVFSKLIEAGLIQKSDLDQRMPYYERTVALTVFNCPACGMPQLSEFDECPQCGIIVKKYLERQEPKSKVRTIVEKQHRVEPTETSEKEVADTKTVRISSSLWEELKSFGGNLDDHVTSAISMYVLKNKDSRFGK